MTTDLTLQARETIDMARLARCILTFFLSVGLLVSLPVAYPSINLADAAQNSRGYKTMAGGNRSKKRNRAGKQSAGKSKKGKTRSNKRRGKKTKNVNINRNVNITKNININRNGRRKKKANKRSGKDKSGSKVSVWSSNKKRRGRGKRNRGFKTIAGGNTTSLRLNNRLTIINNPVNNQSVGASLYQEVTPLPRGGNVVRVTDEQRILGRKRAHLRATRIDSGPAIIEPIAGRDPIKYEEPDDWNTVTVNGYSKDGDPPLVYFAD